MSARVQRLKDVAKQATALALFSAPVAIFWGPPHADARPSKTHAANCRTCGSSPPGAAEALDDYLVRTGSIEAESAE